MTLPLERQQLAPALAEADMDEGATVVGLPRRRAQRLVRQAFDPLEREMARPGPGIEERLASAVLAAVAGAASAIERINPFALWANCTN
jgi:hypothetical protein